ncbi:MAG: hypothetical protein FWC36_06430 [Spirochaetes bacterium]|nr:hypothetical protein [Spirochaetota bacterium]
MSNELQQLPNPDNVPGAVTTGYQRQNTNMFAIQTGIDTTEPFDDGEGVITIPIGGIVEVNGVLYRITENVTLQKPQANTAYWVAITPVTDGRASATLVTRPGKWDSAKQGCYLADGRRTLNWVSLGELDNIEDFVNDSEPFFSRERKGTYEVNLKKGWYLVDLASGAGGGNGATAAGTGTNIHLGAAGGVPVTRRTARKIVFSNGKQHLAKVGGNGSNGGNGGNGTVQGSNRGGGAGGGGSGSGEESRFDDIATGIVPAGNGGNGRNCSRGPGVGGVGGLLGNNGGGRGGLGRGTNGGGGGGGGGSSSCGGGEHSIGWNVTGGTGGNGGIAGELQPDGSPGGHCRIFTLGDVV